MCGFPVNFPEFMEIRVFRIPEFAEIFFKDFRKMRKLRKITFLDCGKYMHLRGDSLLKTQLFSESRKPPPQNLRRSCSKISAKCAKSPFWTTENACHVFPGRFTTQSESFVRFLICELVLAVSGKPHSTMVFLYTLTSGDYHSNKQ